MPALTRIDELSQSSQDPLSLVVNSFMFAFCMQFGQSFKCVGFQEEPPAQTAKKPKLAPKPKSTSKPKAAPKPKLALPKKKPSQAEETPEPAVPQAPEAPDTEERESEELPVVLKKPAAANVAASQTPKKRPAAAAGRLFT